MEKVDAKKDTRRRTSYTENDSLSSQQDSFNQIEGNQKDNEAKEVQADDESPTVGSPLDDYKGLTQRAEVNTKTSTFPPNALSSASSGPQVFVVRPLPNRGSITLQRQKSPDHSLREKHSKSQSIIYNSSKGFYIFFIL